MKYLLIFIYLISFSVNSSVFLELSGGLANKQLKGDSKSFKSNPSAASEVSIGYRFENLELALDGTYLIGRQKEFETSYNNSNLKDDFNWHSISVGPTFRYNIKSSSGKWAYAPFFGIYYNHSLYENSADLVDSTLIEEESEDNSHETWGYGGKIGVQFKSYQQNSSWLESINYTIFGSYTKFEKTKGRYQNNSSIGEYSGDTPDNLIDYSAGIMIGLGIGDKVYNKIKSLFSGF